MATLDLLRWIPLIPLGAAVFNIFIGSKLGKTSAGMLASLAVGASFAIALYVFWLLPANGVFKDALYTWIESGALQVKLSFQVDALTAVMLLIVTGIGFLFMSIRSATWVMTKTWRASSFISIYSSSSC